MTHQCITSAEASSTRWFARRQVLSIGWKPCYGGASVVFEGGLIGRSSGCGYRVRAANDRNDGLPISRVKRCDTEGRDGTQLDT